MGKLNARQLINRSKLNPDERLLMEHGVVESSRFSGNVLTDLGRRIVLDYIWENDESVRKAIVQALKEVEEEEKDE